MPFPLPVDPQFRKEVIEFWLEDIEDRIEMNALQGALDSWKIANGLYLELPAGHGDPYLEDQLMALRVKLTKLIDN